MAPDAEAAKSLNSRPDPFAPLTSQLLPVGDGHEIYVESVGRSDGISAVYLHGGPGSGCQPDHRRLFDPERFHAVFFDQRGAGRSRPKGRREDNTLPHLIADMEMIREKFGFERWIIVGGSWGASCAGLASRPPFRGDLTPMPAGVSAGEQAAVPRPQESRR
jgi:proline iminopeptidase